MRNLCFLDLLEDLYDRYLKDPKSIYSSWRGFFGGMEFVSMGTFMDSAQEDARVFRLIEAYKRYGHKKNRLDPLLDGRQEVAELDLRQFGLGNEDLSREVFTFGLLKEEKAPLSSVIQALEEKFCSGIGFEILGLSQEIDLWARSHLQQTILALSAEHQRRLLEDLVQAELFEAFLHARYPGQTRFSLEGAETLIPLLHFLLEIG